MKHKKVGKITVGGGGVNYIIDSIFQNLLRHRMKKDITIAVLYDKGGAIDCDVKAFVFPLQFSVVQQICFSSPVVWMVVAHAEVSHPASSLV